MLNGLFLFLCGPNADQDLRSEQVSGLIELQLIPRFPASPMFVTLASGTFLPKLPSERSVPFGGRDDVCGCGEFD